MFRFLDAFRNAPIPARERTAFVAALVVTVGIGAVWFSLSFGFRMEQSTKHIAENTSAPATASADSIAGPFARLRASAADAAVSIAAQVGTIAHLWKSYLFPPPLQFERQDASNAVSVPETSETEDTPVKPAE